jgi:hypothetical protein
MSNQPETAVRKRSKSSSSSDEEKKKKAAATANAPLSNQNGLSGTAAFGSTSQVLGGAPIIRQGPGLLSGSQFIGGSQIIGGSQFGGHFIGSASAFPQFGAPQFSAPQFSAPQFYNRGPVFGAPPQNISASQFIPVNSGPRISPVNTSLSQIVESKPRLSPVALRVSNGPRVSPRLSSSRVNVAPLQQQISLPQFPISSSQIIQGPVFSGPLPLGGSQIMGGSRFQGGLSRPPFIPAQYGIRIHPGVSKVDPPVVAKKTQKNKNQGVAVAAGAVNKNANVNLSQGPLRPGFQVPQGQIRQGPLLPAQGPLFSSQGPFLSNQGPLLNQRPLHSSQGPLLPNQGPLLPPQGQFIGAPFGSSVYSGPRAFSAGPPVLNNGPFGAPLAFSQVFNPQLLQQQQQQGQQRQKVVDRWNKKISLQRKNK